MSAIRCRRLDAIAAVRQRITPMWLLRHVANYLRIAAAAIFSCSSAARTADIHSRDAAFAPLLGSGMRDGTFREEIVKIAPLRTLTLRLHGKSSVRQDFTMAFSYTDSKNPRLPPSGSSRADAAFAPLRLDAQDDRQALACFPIPPARISRGFLCALSPTPPQGGSDTGAPYASLEITPPWRGSRRSRAEQAKADAVGGGRRPRLAACPAQHQTSCVTRTSSSRVVRPDLTFSNPSSRSVLMPCSRA